MAQWHDTELRTAMDDHIRVVEEACANREIASKAAQHISRTLRKASDELADRSERMIVEVVDAEDSPGKLKAARKRLDRAIADIRELLREHARFARLRVAEVGAETRAKRIHWHVMDACSRIDALRSRSFYERLGLSPMTPITFGPDAHRANWVITRDRLRSTRRLAYSTLWSASKQYVYWTWRHLLRRAKTSAVEFLIAFLLLGQGIGALVGLVEEESLLWGLALGALIEVLSRYAVGPWLDERFLRQRKEALIVSIRDFHIAALRTYVHLALADTLRDAFLDGEGAPSGDEGNQQ